MTQAPVSNPVPGQVFLVLSTCELRFVRSVPKDDLNDELHFVHVRSGRPITVKKGDFYTNGRPRLMH